jgi:hypothetical protein
MESRYSIIRICAVAVGQARGPEAEEG